jgi:ATP-binding cassette subfamily B (MDR/TAP) protein 1
MPISYFDIPKNNAGTLTSRLSVDAKQINGLTSTVLGVNVMNCSSLVCGMVIAFVASWALTLVSLALSPLVFVGGLLQAKFVAGFSDKSDGAYKDSGNLIMEAVTNIRTV